MSDKYILDGHTPVPASLMEWASWFEKAERHVAVTEKDGVKVSTVFLGLDHNWGEGPPILFETMIFGGSQAGYQDRCSTWDEAEAMHAKACNIAFGACGPADAVPTGAAGNARSFVCCEGIGEHAAGCPHSAAEEGK